jgi:hypothetical protein
VADLSDIPAEAVTAGVERLSDWLAAYDVGLDEFERLGPTAVGVVHAILSAALPVLNTAKDSETAEPDLIMGNRPDGSPWVISAEFARSDVRVDGHGALRLHGKAISPAAAYKLATGLLAAIGWLENDGAAKAEAAASLRGEQP